MTRCPKSLPKHRCSVTEKGKPSDYRHGMRGHNWEKTEYGRRCRACKIKHFKPFTKLAYLI